MVNASAQLTASFVALALLVAGAFVVAVHRSARATGHTPAQARREGLLAVVGTAAWLGATALAAAGGLLSFTSRPPTMLLLVAAIVIVAVTLGVSRLGERLATGLPLAVLVGAQAFRFPLELIMHRAYAEGLMPVQMSYAGRNFDIVTGVSALLVATVLIWRPRALALARLWNVMGVVLLANILVIAMLSAPTPFRVFHNEPANIWVTQAPWVWLPAVFVLAAILGHLLVFRRLRREARAGAGAASGGRAAAMPHPVRD